MNPDGTVDVNLPDENGNVVPGDKVEIFPIPESDDLVPEVSNLKVKVCKKLKGTGLV